MRLFNAKSKIIIRGKYDRDADVVLFHGRCEDLLETIPPESVDLVITSPPYNLGKEYEKKSALVDYLKEQEKVISTLHRVLAPTGSICWEVGNFVTNGEVYPLDVYFYQIFKKMGMKMRNRIIWRFGHGLHASKRFSGRYEVILWFTKGDEYIFNLDSVRVPSKYPGKRYYKGPKRGQPSGNPLGKNPSDVWDIVARDWAEEIWEIPNVKANHPEKTMHPCQFPVELVERCILALTNPGDTVLDPYCGVGSSLIAAIKTDRRCIGAEKVLEYVSIAKRRIALFIEGKLPVRPLGKPIHKPTRREKVSLPPPEWEIRGGLYQ